MFGIFYGQGDIMKFFVCFIGITNDQCRGSSRDNFSWRYRNVISNLICKRKGFIKRKEKSYASKTNRYANQKKIYYKDDSFKSIVSLIVMTEPVSKWSKENFTWVRKQAKSASNHRFRTSDRITGKTSSNFFFKRHTCSQGSSE